MGSLRKLKRKFERDNRHKSMAELYAHVDRVSDQNMAQLRKEYEQARIDEDTKNMVYAMYYLIGCGLHEVFGFGGRRCLRLFDWIDRELGTWQRGSWGSLRSPASASTTSRTSSAEPTPSRTTGRRSCPPGTRRSCRWSLRSSRPTTWPTSASTSRRWRTAGSRSASGWTTAGRRGNDEYNEFLDKFEPRKTTDDCYTPDLVYDAVADWVAKEYGLRRKNFVRPFYPGGDYQKETYAKNAVVVDNPPFSILSQILKWYKEHGIRFFLFAPTLTLFSSSSSTACAIPTGASVIYKNGASVNTSFLTNLEPEGTRIRTAPTLNKVVQDASDETQKALHKDLPKYSYPDYVITSAMVAHWSKYGIDFRLSVADSVQIEALDAQKEVGKAIFGKGYLLSERAAVEARAAASAAAAAVDASGNNLVQTWELSERESHSTETGR